MAIPVIVLNWNGLEDTLECVRGLLAMDHDDFRVVVVDNGSDGDDLAQLQQAFVEQARVEVRGNDANLGFTRGMNRELEKILEASEAEHVALLNNDAIPERNWLSMLESAARESNADMVASKMIRYRERDRIDNAGHIMLNTGEILPRGPGDSAEQFNQVEELVGACAGAVLMSTRMLHDLGLFDEYFQTGYEDAELGLRAFLAGYPTRYCPEAVVYHKVSQSVDKIRDFEFAVKLQQDINYTYLKLMPLSVIALNSPFMVIKHLGILLAALVLFRWRLLRVQFTAFRRTLAELPAIFRARRSAHRFRRVSTWRVLKYQKFFLGTYFRYFWRYIVAGKKTVFER